MNTTIRKHRLLRARRSNKPVRPDQYPTPGITGCAAEDEFVNYTKVAADYREYGERTPRDHLVVQAGAGSNMSATIPPSIDGEVVDYEEEITVDETQQNVSDDGEAGTGDGYNADDPGRRLAGGRRKKPEAVVDGMVRSRRLAADLEH